MNSFILNTSSTRKDIIKYTDLYKLVITGAFNVELNDNNIVMLSEIETNADDISDNDYKYFMITNGHNVWKIIDNDNLIDTNNIFGEIDVVLGIYSEENTKCAILISAINENNDMNQMFISNDDMHIVSHKDIANTEMFTYICSDESTDWHKANITEVVNYMKKYNK